MEHVVEGVTKFRRDIFPSKEASFKRLAYSQSPKVLFITCSDSRIDPNLITQTDPGELFICRNAGNVVPPHTNETGGMTASIEYAVAALGVADIIVCGHTNCGAMAGAVSPESLGGLPHVREWLGHCRAAVEIVRHKTGDINEDSISDVTVENVALQLQHLRTHPAVAARLATKELRLHGWMYDIETGVVYSYNADNGELEIVGDSPELIDAMPKPSCCES